MENIYAAPNEQVKLPSKKWETPQIIKIEILANTISAMTEGGGFGTLAS